MGLVFVMTVQHALAGVRDLLQAVMATTVVVFWVESVGRPVVVVLLELVSILWKMLVPVAGVPVQTVQLEAVVAIHAFPSSVSDKPLSHLWVFLGLCHNLMFHLPEACTLSVVALAAALLLGDWGLLVLLGH